MDGPDRKALREDQRSQGEVGPEGVPLGANKHAEQEPPRRSKKQRLCKLPGRRSLSNQEALEGLRVQFIPRNSPPLLPPVIHPHCCPPEGGRGQGAEP